MGKVFHNNGGVYIEALFPDDLDFSHRINNLLLVGYYMVNLGYVAVVLGFWEPVYTWASMVSSLTEKAGLILLILSLMHYVNMVVIYLIAKNQIHLNNNNSNS